MQPGDRLICCLVEPITVGSKFKDWRLHITIVPWFRINASSEQITSGLTKVLTTISSFKVNVGETAEFGPRRRAVNLIEPSKSLSLVEQKVRHYLHQKRAWLVDETTKKHYEFRPHVTSQGEKKLTAGDEIEVNELFMIEQFGDYKQVVTKVNFGEQTAA